LFANSVDFILTFLESTQNWAVGPWRVGGRIGFSASSRWPGRLVPEMVRSRSAQEM
jgi:hypothetical protein